MKSKKFAYEVLEIGSNTYLVNEFFSTMFVLVGEKRALVIDCGTGVGDFKGVIENITSLPYDVAMTHSHVDHIGGRWQFSDIFVSEKDAKYIKSVNLLQRKGFVLTNKSFNNYTGLSITKGEKEPEVHIIKEDDVFDLGGRTVKVIETPGHTVGSLSFLDVERRTIYIGDVANEFLFMFLPHCTTIDEMIETHNKLLSLESYDTVWSSHNVQPNTKADFEKFRDGACLVAKRKNGLLPIIKVSDYNGAKLIYRSTVIHKKQHNKPKP